MLLLFIIIFLNQKEVTISKLKKTPKIDGIISREEWDFLNAIDDFVEVQPEEGLKPLYKTKCFLGYDENNIYFSFICYDEIKTVRKTLTRRDEFAMDDMVLIYINTYGKGEEGYIFATNPLSVQFDGVKKAPPDNLEDFAFDTDFEVKAFISDSFWSAEFRIPFSSLRFETKEKQEWKIILARLRPRESVEVYSWPGISRNNPSFFGQGATLIIPERIFVKKKNLDLIPYLICSQNGIREVEEYNFDRGKFDLGLSGRYRFLQNFILDFALNPDFAQIETDLPQIDVNTTFALYYPEKRPFFMEGSKSVETPIHAFYTRMVNNPIYGLKLTGRISPFEFYFLSSYDENTPYILPFEDLSFDFPTNKKSFINILRIKSDFLNKESYIGFLMSDREVKKDSFENGFNRILGLDTKIRFLKHYTFSYQGIYSKTKEPNDTNLFNIHGLKFKDYTWKFDGEEFYGFAQEVMFSAIFRNLYSSFYYDEYSPGFRSDIGFIERNNFKRQGFKISPRFYPIKYGFSEISIFFKYQKELNYKNIFKKEDFTFGLEPNLNFAQTGFGISWSKTNKNVFNPYINNYQYFDNLKILDFWFRSTPKKWLTFGSGLNIGNSIYYSYPEYTPAWKIYIWGNFTILLTRLIFSSGGERYYLYKERYKDIIYDVSTLWSSLSYSFTKNLSLRFILTYNTYYKNPGIYPLISCQLDPFTVFYLGASVNTLKYDEPFGICGHSHQIFAKFQYWFKM